ncbi:hypothetical protein DOTSEDRAFT_27924 [Dothistroma septosporum NZE10]|uniref:Uncharacterized protein n=1 Tax=Dothistroma septosporum (strain NZE10 / CBS 128990) TaxID=675120 RepID=N1PC52_DOTSN|nr:hypothetical protein DOTSEDRAFT_27924 [Dothistroma septosporum NZE10]
MPFEFTGALPPRLDAPSSFASFAFNSTADSKQNTQTSVPLFKIIPAPPVNSGLTRPLPQPRAISDDFGVVPPPSAKNPLEKALVRALRDRPAIWGRSDIAGDEVMKGVLKGYERL